LIFFGTVPVAALGAFSLWQKHVPARCSHCAGGMRLEFAGKQMIYTCTSCGYQPWPAPSRWYGRYERLPTA
jgi:hypothetical protein